MHCLHWQREHLDIVCFLSVPQRCCVPGCINSDGGHRFPKEPAKKLKWRVAIKRLDPSTKRLWNPGQYDVVFFNHFASQDYRTTGILGYYLNSNVVFVYHIYFFAMVIYIIRVKSRIKNCDAAFLCSLTLLMWWYSRAFCFGKQLSLHDQS